MSRLFSRAGLRKLAILGFMIAASGVQASDDRAETLGDAMVCMCGCTQLLGRCEMINCPSAPPLRKELAGMINAGDDDKSILSAFAAKYGPKILSTPPAKGWFNISAWVAPFAVLAFGAGFVILFLKRRRPAAAGTVPAVPVDSSLYESEIEEELRKLTPED